MGALIVVQQMDETPTTILAPLPDQFGDLREEFYQKIEGILLAATGRHSRTDYLPQAIAQIRGLIAAGESQIARLQAIYEALEAIAAAQQSSPIDPPGTVS